MARLFCPLKNGRPYNRAFVASDIEPDSFMGFFVLNWPAVYREEEVAGGDWFALGGACLLVALLFPPTEGFGCSMFRVDG